VRDPEGHSRGGAGECVSADAGTGAWGESLGCALLSACAGALWPRAVPAVCVYVLWASPASGLDPRLGNLRPPRQRPAVRRDPRRSAPGAGWRCFS